MQKIFSLIGNFFVKFGYLDSLFPAIVRTFLHHLEKQKENFKNHRAIFKDLGNKEGVDFNV